MRKVFEFHDYKAFLLHMIAEERAHGAGYKKKLARAMNAPASFLSQVLHGKAELSLDHAFRLVKFWHLSEPERDYFFDLVQLARAGTQELKTFLEEKIARAQAAQEILAKRFQKPEIEDLEKQLLYYSRWQLAAIHLLLGVPGLNQEDALATRLRLPEEVVAESLEQLERLGLAERTAPSRWERKQGSIHLGKTSLVSPVNHVIWRNKTIQALQEGNPKNFHYSALHTLSRADAEKIKKILLESVDATRAIVEPSPEEELVCLNFDLFFV